VAPPSPLLAVPNVTAHQHQSTASVPITVLLYDGQSLCGFNMAIKGLTVGHSNMIKCALIGCGNQTAVMSVINLQWSDSTDHK